MFVLTIGMRTKGGAQEGRLWSCLHTDSDYSTVTYETMEAAEAAVAGVAAEFESNWLQELLWVDVCQVVALARLRP